MTHPSELMLSMHADAALSEEESAAMERHIAECAACRANFDALVNESRILSAALARDGATVTMPAFQKPLSLAGFAGLSAAIMCAAVLVSLALESLGGLVPAAVAWFNPLDTPGIADLTVRTVMLVLERGSDIVTSIAQTAALAVIVSLLGWIVFAVRKRISGPLLVSAVACVVVLQSAPTHALEIRGKEDGDVFVAAEETIDDTLIAFGETVEINGNVNGDVIAVGRRVAIHGRVSGQVFTAGQTVTVDGDVEGSLVGAAETLGVSPGKIGRNLFGFAQSISVNARTGVGQNAVMFAERASIAAGVGRDIYGFAEELEVGSTVGGGVTAYANRVTLLAPARITGDVSTHGPSKDHLTISPSAVVGGEVTTDVWERPVERNPYLTAGFYLGQLLRFAAALLTGVVVLALIPGLRNVSLDSARDIFVAGGVGIVALVAAPIVALIVAITIIGLPLAVIALFLWIVALYLAKVVVAHFVGTRLSEAFDSRPHYAVTLAIGLAAVIVVINVPFVGGIVNFLLTICGIGVLAMFVWRAVRGDNAPVDRAAS